MLFKLLPVIDVMAGFYRQPLTPGRFREYLAILEGGVKGSLSFPVSGFNPMAKGHVREKLDELKQIDAEGIMEEEIRKINIKFSEQFAGRTFSVALNLSDDLKGGWTNRFTSDYDSKFRISGLAGRDFCVPVFWSSEQARADLVRQRTAEYMLRTIYWMKKPKPVTLQQHLAQESFVAQEEKSRIGIPADKLAEKQRSYERHKDSQEYAVIFNFLYGDAASEALSLPVFGNDGEITGFDFAASRLII